MDDVLDGFDGGGDSDDLGGFTGLAFLSALLACLAFFSAWLRV